MKPEYKKQQLQAAARTVVSYKGKYFTARTITLAQARGRACATSWFWRYSKPTWRGRWAGQFSISLDLILHCCEGKKQCSCWIYSLSQEVPELQIAGGWVCFREMSPVWSLLFWPVLMSLYWPWSETGCWAGWTFFLPLHVPIKTSRIIGCPSCRKLLPYLHHRYTY